MDLNDVPFMDPGVRVEISRNRLPHWQHQDAATYFLTYRLGDSLPREQWELWRAQRDEWQRTHSEPWSPEMTADYHRRFSVQMERWLDAGAGTCVLRDPQVAKVIADVWARDEEQGFITMVAWVIMPNHVHALATLAKDSRLATTVQRWKSVSTRGVNAVLGRRGGLWQCDYFDRLVRGPEHFEKCVRYIRANPAKAGLPAGECMAYENNVARAVV